MEVRMPNPAVREVWTGDPELDPALEDEFYEEPPELKERLDIEMNQE
jgi:hypothetical protein